MHGEYSTSGFWNRPNASRQEFRSWLARLRAPLNSLTPDLGLVFVSPPFFDRAQELLTTLQEETGVKCLVGCSANSVVAGELEIEDEAAVAVGLYYLPGAELTPVRLLQQQVEESNGAGYWLMESRIDPESVHSWLVFGDPFSFDAERWLAQWTDAFPSIPVFGGMASGNYSSRTLQVYCGGNVYQEGAVALAIGGGVRLSGIVSQGCTPIGDAWTITKAEGNLILEIANQPARKLLQRTLDLLSPEERELSRNNLFVGLAMDEYKTELERGDFLIRNILEADPDLGSLAIGALPRVGQTVQFHRRDKLASEEDFTVLLRRAQNQLAGHRIFGACLCSCNGRGRRLFGPVNHDAAKTQQAFGPTGVAGFFCNGEFGPVGDQSFLHGYTASLALFTEHRVAGQGFLDSPSGLPQP